MERVRNAVERERTAWRLHHADLGRKIAFRETLPIHQRPEYPASDVPDEAIRNLADDSADYTNSHRDDHSYSGELARYSFWRGFAL